MIGRKIVATGGGIGVGGDNSGTLINVNAGAGAQINLQLDQREVRELPSYLNKIILKFSQEQLSQYGTGAQREFPPEVKVKLQYNNIEIENPLIRHYSRFVFALENAYLTSEKSNLDARFLVIRKAGVVYGQELNAICSQSNIPLNEQSDYARMNGTLLLDRVITSLINDYASSSVDAIEQEMVHLAISLIVTDAIVECEVLEKPRNAVAT